MIAAPPPCSRLRRTALLAVLAANFAIAPLALPAPPQASSERIVIPADRFSARPAEEQVREGGSGALASDRRFNFEGFRSQVMGLWFKRKLLLQKNLLDAAAEQTTAIQQLCGDIGVTRLDDVSAALVHEGRSFTDEGNFEKARRSFEDAKKFAPDLPEAHLGLAGALWASGAGAGATLAETFAGVSALFRNSALSSAFLGNALLVALLAFALTGVLFSLAMIVRYQLLVRHDLEETLAARYANRISREAQLLVGWALLLLPLITWIAALWTPAYWLALTFRYQKAREKAISASLLVLLILSAPAARAAEILFGLAADPSARLLLASTSGSYDPEQVVSLEQKADADPLDPAYRFMLGALYARGHYVQEALAQYQQVLALDPGSHRALNNIGNIYLRSGRPEEALKHYKNALARRPDFLPALYNSYLARKELLQLKEAEQALTAAQQLDPAGLSRLIEDARGVGSSEPVDAIITRDEVFRRVLGDQRGTWRVVSSLLSLPSIIAALFLAAAFLVTRILGEEHAIRCVRCGEPFCAHCKVGDRVPDYCSQCQHIAIAREALSPSIRREKSEQAERFREGQVRLARISSMLLPGMGRLLDGRTLTGALLAAAWSGALLALVLRPHLLQPASAGPPRPLILVTLLLALLALGAWVAGNIRPARQADAPAGAWQWR